MYIKFAVDSGTVAFKLSEVHSIYINRLKDSGVDKMITRLKTDLLEHFSEAQEQNDGKITVIVFEKSPKMLQFLLRQLH